MPSSFKALSVLKKFYDKIALTQAVAAFAAFASFCVAQKAARLITAR